MRRVRRTVVAAAVATTVVGASLSLSTGSVSAAEGDDIEGIIEATGESSGSIPDIIRETAVPLPVDHPPATSDDDGGIIDATGPSSGSVPDVTLVTAVPLPVDTTPVPDASPTVSAINGPASTPTSTTTTTVPAPPSGNAVGGTVFVDFNRNGADDGAAADPRAAGVGIIVVWDGADGQPGTGDDEVFRAVTDGNGAFRLGGLHDGGYTVAINPGMIPADATVTIDPDGGLADATSVITLSGGASNLSQNFGLGTRPPDLEDAVVVTDNTDSVGEASLTGAPSSDGPAQAAAAPAADGLLLPATGSDEAIVSLYIAIALLLSGLALMAIRGRSSNLAG